MKHSFGSLFAGVGGFDLGFEAAGYDCKFQVEWDNHCQQTLEHHWPQVPKWGDVSEVSGYELPPVDVITYGFPCQDLSVAGNRAGLDGDRSGLFFEAIRIIKEMREQTNGQYPTWAVAENVPGLLNADRGDAMARCLDTLAEAGALVIEWCIVDAQWFGVPQRRRRVFLAACFDPATAERCPDQIFPVAKSGARNPAESEPTGQKTSRIIANSIDSTVEQTDGLAFVPEQTTAVCAKWAKGSSGPSGDETRNMIAFHPHYSDGARPQTKGTSPSVTALWGTGGNNGLMIAQPIPMQVRRLTPLECERLMGWPDNHTLHRADGKQNSDTARYKMCGNGVVAPVSAWIAKQISKVL
jgi:DNA (cytosine-5)-methyltransferase 1